MYRGAKYPGEGHLIVSYFIFWDNFVCKLCRNSAPINGEKWISSDT